MIVSLTRSAHGQPGWTASATQTGDPATLDLWSPLSPIALHQRALPRAPAAPQIILLTRPLTGAFWTAGNPAALAAEAGEPHGELRAGASGAEGAYRRPLDALESRAVQLSGLAWRPLGEHAGAVGRIILDQEDVPVSEPTLRVEPYVSNPFVLTDTISPRMVRSRARLEGGMGWSYRGWRIGGSAGIESREQRSQFSSIRRAGRATLPGITLGVARRLPIGQMWLGARGRWTGGNETGSTAPPPNASTRLFVLRGLDEPEAVNAPGVPTLRRIESSATSFGVDLTGELLGARYVVYADRTEREETQISTLAANPPSDRWEAEGMVLGGSLQRELPRSVVVTMLTRLSTIEGTATRADLEGTVFDAEESRFLLSFDARWIPASGVWRGGLRVQTARDWSIRTDYLAELRSEIEAWSPGATAEIVRRIGADGWISAAVGRTWYSAASTIPAPDELGPEYRRLIAPELALMGRAATGTGVTFTVWQRVGGSNVWLRAHRESLSPSDREPIPSLAPEGDRSGWQLSLGLRL
jgi:hypothetical protein